jgi:hypothetical protein
VGFISRFKGFLCRDVECRAWYSERPKLFACDASLTEAKRAVLNRTSLSPAAPASFDCRKTFQLVSDSQQLKPQRFYQNIQNRNTQPITKHYKVSNMALFSEHPLFDTPQVKAIFLFHDVSSSPSLQVKGQRGNITGFKAAGT